MIRTKSIIYKKISTLKLTNKFTILILGVLMVPIGVFSLLIFNNMETSLYKDGQTQMVYELEKSCQTAEQIVVNCNLSTQMIINNESMNDFLNQLDSNKEFSFMDILDFYGKEISGVQKMIRNNPYIYKIRIFVNSATVKETIPLLYKKEKMKELKWGKDGVPPSGTWCFDYEDTLDLSGDYDENPRIAAIITRLNDYRYGQYGVIEVAVTMETIFTDIYHSTDMNWTSFLDSSGNFYYDNTGSSKWSSNIEEISILLKENFESNLSQNDACLCQQVRLNGEEVLIGYKKINSLGGYLIRIVSLSSEKQVLKLYIIDFLLVWIVIGAALLLFAKRQVSHILRQFYDIYEVVYQVQQGNLDKRVRNTSQDEFGVLGKEINKMLNQIQKLMDETLRRELIVKDSQIKALQNQINAHFIYNVLESVKMMAEIEEKYEIADAVSSFGKLLRYSMRWKSQFVTVEEEIDYIKSYLMLVNLQFDHEICLSIHISQEIMKQEIPKMSLQPIIENAISHGMEEITEDTSIYMKGVIEGDDCYIKITDRGCGMSEEEVDLLCKRLRGEIQDTSGTGNGIGLKNVQDRLQISFGLEYGITVSSKEGSYTQVAVKIPYQKTREELCEESPSGGGW
ncbi:MAG: sensor histidine kinase [Lachnotalea sp.]